MKVQVTNLYWHKKQLITTTRVILPQLGSFFRNEGYERASVFVPYYSWFELWRFSNLCGAQKEDVEGLLLAVPLHACISMWWPSGVWVLKGNGALLSLNLSSSRWSTCLTGLYHNILPSRKTHYKIKHIDVHYTVLWKCLTWSHFCFPFAGESKVEIL